MLEVRNLCVSYGQHRALDEVSLNVDKGEIVVILGANGAGKSSLLQAIGGLSEGTTSGSVSLDGQAISGLPSHEIVERGIALVPEGRGVFTDLNVRENLLLGAYTSRARRDQDANMDLVLGLFPKLAERMRQIVRTMSGGEQQMVAIGRALMSSPRILMLDEPSLGLSPLLCKELFRSLAEVRKSGMGILLVEQNAKQSLAIADRGYLLENARIIGENSAKNLADDPAVQKAYLGVSSSTPRSPSPTAQAAVVTTSQVEATTATQEALAFITAGAGQVRTRTDDVVIGGIDELVRHAAALATNRNELTPSTPPTAMSRVETTSSIDTFAAPDQDLATMLAEMEQAAVAARLPKNPAGNTGGPKSGNGAAPIAATPSRAPENIDDLPEIEVWRRQPELEIYRRKDGKLKPVKGD